MLAKDIMTKQVVAVTPGTAVKDLAKILSKNHIGGAPVVDKNGKVVGIVSDGDLRGRRGARVKSIMNKSVIGVMEDTPVEEIASLMASRHVKRLPVVRDQRLSGIVSRADIIRAVAMGEHIATRTPVYDL
ncbi:MAG TPA: CBS domain-containing protein [Candidatus Binatia bacterium]|nr:CBS domain-containing protein [Candidatus Binatia bacterium]